VVAARGHHDHGALFGEPVGDRATDPARCPVTSATLFERSNMLGHHVFDSRQIVGAAKVGDPRLAMIFRINPLSTVPDLPQHTL
jgi:hypothetical protein